MRNYTRVLTKAQIPYHQFTNGKELIDFVKNSDLINCKLCNRFLILTDLHMPFINGLDLASQIRLMKFKKNVKIVLITADEVPENKLIDYIIEKPLPASKLKQIYYD
mmetsp:Transcript_50548/g.42623  ORF Transcript_50548/g.42623 Transcript_50548/m.42623 type:complete len:107 (+) Transcript_50548:955-1275(+)